MKKQDIFFICIIAAILTAGFLLKEAPYAIYAASAVGLIYISTLYFPCVLKKQNENFLHYIPLIIFTLIIPATCLLHKGTYNANSLKEYAAVTGTLTASIFFMVNIIINKQKIIISKGIIFPYTAFYFSMILPGLVFNRGYESYNYMMQYLILFIAIFLTTNLLRKIIHLKIFLCGITLISAVIGINSIFEFFGMDPFGLAVIDNFEAFGQRVVFTFGNPIYLGGFLLIILQLLLAFFFIVKSNVVKIFIGMIFILNISVLLMTKARGTIAFASLGIFLEIAFVVYVYIISNKSLKIKNGGTTILQFCAAVISSIIFFFLSAPHITTLFNASIIISGIFSVIIFSGGIYIGYKSNRSIKISGKISNTFVTSFLILIGFGILSLAFFYIVHYDMYYSIMDALSNPEKSIYDRFPAFIAAIHIWLQSPIIGNGPGSFYTLSFKVFPGDYKIFTDTLSYRHVHNEYLELLADGGILCLAAFICMIILVFKNAISIINNKNFKKKIRYISCGVLSITISTLLSNLFSPDLRYINIMFLFYVVISTGHALKFMESGLNNDSYSEQCEIKDDNSRFVFSNQKSIIISCIILLLSIFCWYVLRPYYMAEKGMNSTMLFENSFIETYNTVPYFQFEHAIKQNAPYYIKLRNNSELTEKINNEKIFNIAKANFSSAMKGSSKDDLAIMQYYNTFHFLQGIFISEEVFNNLCLSWQPDYIYAHYETAGNYSNLTDMYRSSLDVWPEKRFQILDGLYNTFETSINYYYEINKIIPDFRNINQWIARAYFNQGIINYEINSKEASREKLDSALKYFRKYKNQDYSDIYSGILILYICAIKNDYNEFLNEFKSLLNNEMKRQYYLRDDFESLKFPEKSDKINFIINKKKHYYYIGQEVIKKIYSGISKKDLKIEKAEYETAKLAKSIGDMLKKLDYEDFVWNIFYSYIFKYTKIDDLKNKVANEYIKYCEPEFYNTYKKNDWYNTYFNFKNLKIYGWDKAADYEKYDTEYNRQHFSIYMDLIKRKTINPEDWHKLIKNNEFKADYDSYLNKIFYLDLLKRNSLFKELNVYKQTLIRQGFDVD